MHRNIIFSRSVGTFRAPLRGARRGATAVEFALVLPVLFLFAVGIVEFSRVSMLRHVVDNASYEACRAVIVPGANVTEAEAAAGEILQRFGIRDATITVSPNPIGEETAAVTVLVEAPALTNGWGLDRFTGGVKLASTTTLLTERSPTVQATAVPEPPPPPITPTPTPLPTPNPNPTQPQPQPPTDNGGGGSSPSPSPSPSPPPPPPPPPPML